MTIQEIQQAVKESRKYNIWGNPNRPDDVQENCCEYCGRKLGKNPYFVLITTVGTIVPNTITEDDLTRAGISNQGGFPIGQDCAKKLFGDKLSMYVTK